MMTEKEYFAHKQSLSDIEAAREWFWERGIKAYVSEGGDLYINVDNYEIKVHLNEIEHRAYLYKSDIIG